MTVPLLYILDWTLIAVSFFNTIAMLWLGLTVLLNAERRDWGTWSAGGGLVFGGLFFALHSTIVGRAIWDIDSELGLWWRLGWLPFIGAPYLWYLAMAWYAGGLRLTRYRRLAAVVGALGALAAALLLFADPLPSFDALRSRGPVSVFVVLGVPAAALIYPVYSVLCIALSIMALRRPAASLRFMGEAARERARPWLIAASFGMLGVCLAAGAAVTWLLQRARDDSVPGISARSLAALLGFDLLLSTLLAVVVVLLGKAIVAYEVFTGKALPRGGLARHWRNSLLLAAGYGLLIGGSLDLPIDPVYQVVAAALLVTLFYALLTWRTFVERERGVERLRPFVASQRLYDRLLGPAAPPDLDIAAPFRALCDDLLDTRVGYLAALGPLAPLVGPPLVFPPDAASLPLLDSALAAQLAAPQQLCVPLDPASYGGAVWAVPLWSERGLVGALLIGEKRAGGLYTQEEIELARAAGERLIDTQASAEMSRRLMALQRQRLAESQLLDRRTRRVLHDDVLPRIHAAILQLAADDPSGAATIQQQLADVHHQIANLLRELPPTVAPELARVGLVGALRQLVSGELRGAFDDVTWQIDQAAEQTGAALPPLSAEVFFYAAREALRNAARYGRGGDPARPLHLTVAASGALCLAIVDDGVGLGATQRGAAGSGQGLALHSTMMAVIGGTLTAEQPTSGGTRIVLALPGR